MKLISILLVCLVYNTYTTSSSLSDIKKIKADIIVAIEDNKIKEAKKLIDQIPVNDSLFGSTSLHYAVAHQRQDLVVWLLEEKKANPNLKDKDEKTPLHLTAVKGNLAITKKLLDHNADIDVTTTKGETPLSLAVGNNHPSIVEYLLTPSVSKKTPNVNILYGPEKYTLLHLALLCHDRGNNKEEKKSFLDKKIRIIQQLLNTPINIQTKDSDGDSAIMVLPEVIEYFCINNHMFEPELNAILKLFLKHPSINSMADIAATIKKIRNRINATKETNSILMLEKLQKPLLSRLEIIYKEQESENRRFTTEQEISELAMLSNEMKKNLDTIMTATKNKEDKDRKKILLSETINRSYLKKFFLEWNKEHTARSKMHDDQETEFQKLLLQSSQSYQALSVSESLLQKKTDLLEQLCNEESAEALEIMNSKITEKHTITQKNLFQKFLEFLQTTQKSKKEDALTLTTCNKTITPPSLCSCLNENMAMLGEPRICYSCQDKNENYTNTTRCRSSSVYRPNLCKIDPAVIAYKNKGL